MPDEVQVDVAGAVRVTEVAADAYEVAVTPGPVRVVSAAGQGPPGPPGPAGATYTHAQPTPSATWTIPHGLGRRPVAVTLTDPQYAQFYGSVSYPDPDTAVVTLSVPAAGWAYVG